MGQTMHRTVIRKQLEQQLEVTLYTGVSVSIAGLHQIKDLISNGPIVLVVVGSHKGLVDTLDSHLTAKHTRDSLAQTVDRHGRNSTYQAPATRASNSLTMRSRFFPVTTARPTSV